MRPTRVGPKFEGPPERRMPREEIRPEPGREALLRRLGDSITALQEDCRYAGWVEMTPAIEAVCRTVLETGTPQPWGTGEVSVAVARHLWWLAREVGGWPGFGSDGGYVLKYPFRALHAAVAEVPTSLPESDSSTRPPRP